MGITQMALRLRTKQIDFFSNLFISIKILLYLSAILSKRYLEFFSYYRSRILSHHQVIVSQNTNQIAGNDFFSSFSVTSLIPKEIE